MAKGGKFSKKPAMYRENQSWKAIRKYWRVRKIVNQLKASVGKTEKKLMDANSQLIAANENLDCLILEGDFSVKRCNEARDTVDRLAASVEKLRRNIDESKEKQAGWEADLAASLQQVLALDAVVLISKADCLALIDLKMEHGYAGVILVAPTCKARRFIPMLKKERIPHTIMD